MPTEYKNILLIKPGAIGDLLQLTPVIAALAARYAGSRISVLTGSAASATLFAHHPQVHAVLVYDKRGQHRRFAPFASLWQQLRSARYDLVINFQRSNLGSWLLVGASLPCRVLVYHKSRSTTIHVVDNYLSTLRPLGIAGGSRRLHLDPGPEADRFAADLFTKQGWTGRPVIALNPGASHRVNRWSTGRFAELADLIALRLHAAVVIVGGRDDVGLAEAIRTAARSPVVVAAGTLDLLQLGAVLKRCSVLVSGDTGPLHLATAVSVPVVALFGAADPARTGPVGERCRVLRATGVACVPCRSRTCANSVPLACMDRISASEVLEAVLDVMRMP